MAFSYSLISEIWLPKDIELPTFQKSYLDKDFTDILAEKCKEPVNLMAYQLLNARQLQSNNGNGHLFTTDLT